MTRLLDLVPEANHAELERYLLSLVSEIRNRRNTRHMHEVCGKRATERETMKAACRRVAQLPDEQALSSLHQLFPNWAEEGLVANLQLARKKLKRELRNRRDHEIAALTRQGLSNSDIAAKLGVSVSTAARKAAQAVRGELP